MNLAQYNLPSNLNSSLHKTWQTLLETSPNTNPKEKKVGGHGILYPPPEKVGGYTPCSPPNCAHVTKHNFGPDFKLH